MNSDVAPRDFDFLRRTWGTWGLVRMPTRTATKRRSAPRFSLSGFDVEDTSSDGVIKPRGIDELEVVADSAEQSLITERTPGSTVESNSATPTQSSPSSPQPESEAQPHHLFHFGSVVDDSTAVNPNKSAGKITDADDGVDGFSDTSSRLSLEVDGFGSDFEDKRRSTEVDGSDLDDHEKSKETTEVDAVGRRQSVDIDVNMFANSMHQGDTSVRSSIHSELEAVEEAEVGAHLHPITGEALPLRPPRPQRAPPGYPPLLNSAGPTPPPRHEISKENPMGDIYMQPIGLMSTLLIANDSDTTPIGTPVNSRPSSPVDSVMTGFGDNQLGTKQESFSLSGFDNTESSLEDTLQNSSGEQQHGTSVDDPEHDGFGEYSGFGDNVSIRSFESMHTDDNDAGMWAGDPDTMSSHSTLTRKRLSRRPLPHIPGENLYAEVPENEPIHSHDYEYATPTMLRNLSDTGSRLSSYSILGSPTGSGHEAGENTYAEVPESGPVDLGNIDFATNAMPRQRFSGSFRMPPLPPNHPSIQFRHRSQTAPSMHRRSKAKSPPTSPPLSGTPTTIRKLSRAATKRRELGARELAQELGLGIAEVLAEPYKVAADGPRGLPGAVLALTDRLDSNLSPELGRLAAETRIVAAGTNDGTFLFRTGSSGDVILTLSDGQTIHHIPVKDSSGAPVKKLTDRTFRQFVQQHLRPVGADALPAPLLRLVVPRL